MFDSDDVSREIQLQVELHMVASLEIGRIVGRRGRNFEEKFVFNVFFFFFLSCRT